MIVEYIIAKECKTKKYGVPATSVASVEEYSKMDS